MRVEMSECGVLYPLQLQPGLQGHLSAEVSH